MRALRRAELLLVLSCAAASAMLGASQFIDMFHLVPPGGEAEAAQSSQDQHGYAMLVLAVLSLVLLAVWLLADPESGPLGLRQIAAFGVAATGVVALVLFLTVDLPDVNKIGTLEGERFVDAKAEPRAGFWLELVGSMVLAACGIGLATMPGGERRPATAAPEGAEQRPAPAPVEREPTSGH